ncbi:MAG: hypothetical protein RL364_608 [Pseudomonadota bacterium]|jgi:hypothetical protein
MAAIWQDEGTWIALGISALFLVAALVMHRVFVKVLKSGSPEQQEKQDE